MIDSQGYRANVGIIIANHMGQVFWGRRTGNAHAWQFPQGGILSGESPEQALYRELHEETGLQATDIKIVASINEWLRYKLPKHLIRHHTKPVCIGQKQRWFLLTLITDDTHICLNATESPEFDEWHWVDYWHPLTQVIDFKYPVYETVLKEFSPYMDVLTK